jgi:hypothetical protein
MLKDGHSLQLPIRTIPGTPATNMPQMSPIRRLNRSMIATKCNRVCAVGSTSRISYAAMARVSGASAPPSGVRMSASRGEFNWVRSISSIRAYSRPSRASARKTSPSRELRESCSETRASFKVHLLRVIGSWMPRLPSQLKQGRRRASTYLGAFPAPQPVGEVVDESGRRVLHRCQIEVARRLAAGASDLQPGIPGIDERGRGHEENNARP